MTFTATGDALLESALVVTIHDGRLGFVTTPAKADLVLAAPQVRCRGSVHAVSGVAEVVRSGTAYGEVVGRTRMAEGYGARLLDRLRPRRPRAVVLVTPDP